MSNLPQYSVRVVSTNPEVTLVPLTGDELQLLNQIAAQRALAYVQHQAAGMIMFPAEQQMLNRWVALSDKLERAMA